MESMKEPIVYRLEEFSDSDFSRLIRLTESTYPGREISDEKYLQWEYNNNPDGKALIQVASEGEKFVSQYVVIPHKFVMNGNVLTGSLSLNTLTHPIHRGNALFPKLAELTFQSCLRTNAMFTLGIPNANSCPVFIDKLDFEALGRVPFLMKTFKPKSVLWHLFTKKRLKQGNEIELDCNKLQDGSANGISVFNPHQDKEMYSHFLKKFIEEKKVATFRSIEYIRWRYLDVPIRKYYILKSVENGQMTGMAVFRTREIYGLKCCVLLDFICTDESKSAKAFLDYINDFLQRNDIEIIICAMQSASNEFNYLKKAGFYKVPERFLPQQLDLILRIHKKSPEYEPLRDFKSWFFTFGDYDIF